MKNYTVRKGDTLVGISKRYYKTEMLWLFLVLINFKYDLRDGERIFIPNRYNIAFVISLIITITYWTVFILNI